MFEIIQLSIDATPEQMEELGSKPKFWYLYTPRYSEEEELFLFKADNRGTGEDWAEKVSCELCTLLGIPHVHYEMAFHVQTNHPGVICQCCINDMDVLIPANQLLLARDSSYRGNPSRYKAKKHTIETAINVLSTLNRPSYEWCKNIPCGIETALDVFVGYLMLDAWIANQDRHDENWGAIFHAMEKMHGGNSGMRLAPTFDHGAALARNITDNERKERMETRDAGYGIAAFARKARSAFYSQANPKRTLTTHEAWRGIAKYAPDAAVIWLEKLRAVDDNMVENVLYEVPAKRMTDIGREFTARLLNENRSLLLESLDHE